MGNIKPCRVRTISEFHQLRGLPKPEHPQISLIDLDADTQPLKEASYQFIWEFYSVSSIGKTADAKFKYGQQPHDFDEGAMFFMAPNQVFTIEKGREPISPSGWILLIHPDFLWETTLATKIRKYDFFDYSANEALFLSEKEKAIINTIVRNVQQEYRSNIDKFTQDIIISQIETLLNYAKRFYQRQFITRKKSNHTLLEHVEALLSEYFTSKELIEHGLPTPEYVAQRLNVSRNYLSSVLNVLTGQNTQQHIHAKLIDLAKEKLSTTDLTVNEIAYQVGFEYPQSFSKLFKRKTALTPLEFRKSFN
ncbi:AraC family transcriptional regulator [Spirosoma sp. KCTC 42546]|uniref:helix-turn-helix domain-containing protein n=1 Tax=Spirosoma sp. KCTC 42546 TaxID=2520506 RepID=UPI0011596FFD|nr:helix-turn-helix domain-containing protein [Spirosoma sp. KCTC 42546]QDK82356.1 AraC family transcriptional regulator [Spirosoma sp. KCTC 42546]